MAESPDEPSRRQFLARTASVVGLAGVASAGGLAGCSGREGQGGSDGGDGTGDSGGATPTEATGGGGGDSAGDDGSDSTGGGGSDGGQSGSAGLRLETLAVAGSPGESVAVAPQGEVALLDFFATWCAPCKPQMAELRTVREEFPELHMLSLTREQDTTAIKSFWREYEGTWPVAQDPRLKAFQEYGVNRIPTLVVLDAGGSEVWRHSGLAAADSIAEKVREASA